MPALHLGLLPMRVLFIQHDPAARPGLIGADLARRGFDIDTMTVSMSLDEARFDGPFPSARDYDLVVPLGAIWSLHDHATVGSWIDRELDLLREADEHGVPVLGICFGGQALAAAHGGVVEPAGQSEIGWYPIETDDDALVPTSPWMQWHSDRFSVPDGAVEVARGPLGPQAFRLRRNLGLQFHPEVDEATVATWIEMGGAAALEALADAGTTRDEVLAGCRANEVRAAADVERMLDSYLADIAWS